MSKLINDVTSGKRAYQAYTIEHGIERISIQIPLAESKAFEREFNELLSNDHDSKNDLLQLMTRFGGSVRSKDRN